MSDKVLEAVDALAVELGIGKDGLAFTWDQLERINDVLSAHAHELAEQIRAGGIFPPLDETEVRINNAIDSLADLIDPESGVNRCHGCGEPADDGQAHGCFGEFGGCV
ncbi:hypothetical protein [Streptomyces sp. NPDC057557]|uniref:hypothetical protein n=1 Tax=Streptomyces sp. NPDC057557 TaxID=3346167 RepID=UPI00369EA2DC